MKKSIETEDLNMNQLVNNMLVQFEAKDHQMEQFNQTIANLTENINELKRKIFGIKVRNHRIPCIDGQLSLFDQLRIDRPIQELETINVTAHEKKKSRATHDELTKNVPTRTIELEGDARNCSYCNTPMEDIVSKVVREEIHITPAKVERVQYVKHSYACSPCREDGEST